MKLTSSFVLALAAASSVVASPVVVKRQQPSNSLPNPVASVSSAGSSATSRVSSAAASTSTGSAAAPAGPSGTSSAAAPSGTGVIPAGAAPSGTAPGPVVGGNSTTRFNDTQILQYALTLEHLEATFYNQSLSKLSTSDFENAGYNASVRNQIYSIGRDEASHVALLSGALGNKSVPACTYDFSGVTDVDSFLTTARVLEGVGVSAYLGAAQNITNSTYLEIAGSILTVESRHSSYIISQTDDGGNDIPAPYDTPLDFKQVYSLAAPFIASCPSNASLPITAFPALNLTGGATNGSFTPGQQVTVSYSNSTTNSTGSSNGNKYLAIIQGVTGTQFLPLNGNGGSSSQVTLPSNLTGGQMYAVVTSSNRSVTDDNTIAGPAVGYVNIPLPQAPEATATGSSSSSAASSTATGSGSASSANATGTAAAGPAGAAGSSGSMSAPTASAQSGASQAGPTGTQSAPAGPSASGASSQSLGASAISVASANIPRPSASA